MKFVILLALVAVVVADVAHLNQKYLPPQVRQPQLDLRSSFDTVMAVQMDALPEQPAKMEEEKLAESKRPTKLPVLLEEPKELAPHDDEEPAPAHSLDADGYKYKSPF